MAVWDRRWTAGVVALVVVMGAAGSAVYLSARDGQASPPAAPTLSATVSRDLRTTVSVHVVSRKDEKSCAPGGGGVPGPGAGGDWCYFLGPGLDVTRARQVESVRDPETGDYAVNVALVPADRGGFAAWTAQAVGRQIAIRVDGRVVQAPQLETPLDGESLYIFPLVDVDARALVRQLWS